MQAVAEVACRGPIIMARGICPVDAPVKPGHDG